MGTCLFAKTLASNSCINMLLRICCLAANVVSLFVLRSLPSNGSTRYNIMFFICVLVGGEWSASCLTRITPEERALVPIG
jgi:hypothetical protein